jgi:glycine/D-amino acid oxidase-like deaminating enzyme
VATIHGVVALGRRRELVTRKHAVVVGGGIVGCATAYFLAREGASVTLLEREHIAFGASGRNPGFIWLHTRNPGFALDVALAGRQLYDELVEELDAFEFRASGGLVFFLTPEQGRVIEEFTDGRVEDGLEMELVDGAEVRRLVPPIRSDVLGASYCPLDAHMNTPLFVRALAEGARRLGADVREGVAAEGIAFDGDQAVGVVTADGVVEGEAIVAASGVWTRSLLASAGVDLPIGAERLQVIATAPIAERIEPLVYGPLAAKQYELFRGAPSYDDADFVAPYEEAGVELLELLAQRADGSVLLGCPMDYPPTLDLEPTLEGVAVTARAIIDDFPGLRRAYVDRVWAGLLPFTTDTLPLIGEARPGLWVAAGHVYGNAAGPMTGKLLAALIRGHEPDVDLTECRLDRKLEDLPAIGVPTRW